MKKVITGLAALTLLLALAIPALAAPSAQSGQCPGATTTGNTATSDGSIVLPAGLLVCIHAGNGNTGQFTTDGISTLADYILASGLLNNGGQVPGVSNYVIYSEVQPSATPTPSSSPSATPTQSAAPTNTPAPSGTPVVTPTPSSTATFTSSPTPSVDPTSTPTPSVEPTSTATTSPSPTVAPGGSSSMPTPPSTDTSEAVDTLATVATGAILVYMALLAVGVIAAVVSFIYLYGKFSRR